MAQEPIYILDDSLYLLLLFLATRWLVYAAHPTACVVKDLLFLVLGK